MLGIQYSEQFHSVWLPLVGQYDLYVSNRAKVIMISGIIFNHDYAPYIQK